MRSIVAVIAVIALATALSACGKKPKPPLEPAAEVDAGAAVEVGVVDAGAIAVAPVDNLPPPMVIAGYNVPQPRGFRRAQPPDAIGSPQIEPWLARGDIVLIDEAAFPPGIIDVGFVSMLNLPTMVLEACTKLANNAAETEKGALVGEAVLLETGLGATCTYELKLAAGVARGAVAIVDGRALGVMAAHAAGDEKTSKAWSDVVKGMRKTSP